MSRYTEDNRRMSPRSPSPRPARTAQPAARNPMQPQRRPAPRRNPAPSHRNPAPRRAPVRRRKKRASFLPTLLALLALIALVAGTVLLWPRPQPAPRQATFDPYPLRYTSEISAAAQEFGVPPAYLYAVILAESSFRTDATSSVGAMGLMQIMPETGVWIAKKLGMRDSFTPEMLYEPAVSARFGAWYLRFLLDRYDGDMRCATAAYHAGQGKVDKWLDDPAYSPDGQTLAVIASDATNNYVNKVMNNYEQYTAILSAVD